jgi:hypothetical protein
MRSTFLPVRQRPAILPGNGTAPMIVDNEGGQGKGDSNQCVPLWTPSQMETLIRSGALPMPVPRTPISLGGGGAVSTFDWPQNRLHVQVANSQPSAPSPPPDLKTAPSADTPKKSSSSEREISTTGLVMWGYNDFKIGPYRTGIRLSSSALSKPVSDKDRTRVYGQPWTFISRFDPRWITLAKTNPLASNIYAKECGGGGDCMYRSIACVLNILFGSERLCSKDIREMAAEELTSRTLPDFTRYWSHFSAVSKLPVERQLQAGRTFILRPGSWGEVSVLALLVHSPIARKLNLGFAILSIRNRPIPVAERASAGNEPDPVETRRSTRLSAKLIPVTPVASTHIIRRLDTKHLLMLFNVQVGANDCHYVALGVSAAANLAPDTTFPVDSYPRALFPYLQEPS